MSWLEGAKKVMAVGKKLTELEQLLGSGDRDYYLQKMTMCVEALFTRFAPVQVGDRVELTRAPNITPENAPGWMHSKHFLVKGAKGTVRTVDYSEHGFEASIEFDDESWIPDQDYGDKKKGVQVLLKPNEKHTYHFTEGSFKRIPNDQTTTA